MKDHQSVKTQAQPAALAAPHLTTTLSSVLSLQCSAGLYMGTPDSTASMDARPRHGMEDAPHPGEHLLPPRGGALPPQVPQGLRPNPRRHAIHSATLPSVVADRQVCCSQQMPAAH